ncbi:MAG: hypothetical protein V3S09_03445, partial [Candidatus Bathyarchaeia archaeon]
MGSGASYELTCFAVFLVTVLGVWRVWGGTGLGGRRSCRYCWWGSSSVWGGSPRGRSWSGATRGTELVWSYPGYRLYAFMDIPLALLLSWSWWMVACSPIAGRLEGLLGRVLGRVEGLAFVVSAFVSGVLADMVIEPLSVAM